MAGAANKESGQQAKVTDIRFLRGDAVKAVDEILNISRNISKPWCTELNDLLLDIRLELKSPRPNVEVVFACNRGIKDLFQRYIGQYSAKSASSISLQQERALLKDLQNCYLNICVHPIYNYVTSPELNVENTPRR